MGVVGVLDGLEGLLEGRRAVGDLSVGQHGAGLDGVDVANLPRIDADLLGEHVDERLEGELGLAHAEAAESARRRVVRVVAVAADVGVLVLVGADGVRAGALEDRAAQARVGARVEVDLAVHAGEVAGLVAAQGEGAAHVVALGVEGEGLLAGEEALDGHVELIGRERREVLDRDVFLAAEAAADEHGLDDDALGLGVPAEHVRALLAGVVGALVGGPDLHAVLVRGRHGALGLQEGVLGEGRDEGVGNGIGRGSEGRLGVAAGDVALLADVVLEHHVVAEGVERLVDDRGVGGGGLVYVANGRELLVLDLDELLCALEGLAVLGDHKRDGVADAAGDVALRDHDVPVLNEVAHLVDGHVGGGEDAHDAGQGAGFLGVDGHDAGTRVLGADGRGDGQAREFALVEVVGVLAGAQNLRADVGAEDLLADAVALAGLDGGVDGLLAAQDGRGLLYADDDALIARAAADVAANGLGDLRGGRVGAAADERRSREHHARDAEAALDGAGGAEGVDERLALLLAQALDRRDRVADRELGGEDAGLDGAVVDDDGAGAAGALGAAVLHAREVKVVAQVTQDGLVLAGDVLLAVDEEAVFLCHSCVCSPTSCRPGCRRRRGSRRAGTWWRTCRTRCTSRSR